MVKWLSLFSLHPPTGNYYYSAAYDPQVVQDALTSLVSLEGAASSITVRDRGDKRAKGREVWDGIKGGREERGRLRRKSKVRLLKAKRTGENKEKRKKNESG